MCDAARKLNKVRKLDTWLVQGMGWLKQGPHTSSVTHIKTQAISGDQQVDVL